MRNSYIHRTFHRSRARNFFISFICTLKNRHNLCQYAGSIELCLAKGTAVPTHVLITNIHHAVSRYQHVASLCGALDRTCYDI
jgi:hypothetical protein